LPDKNGRTPVVYGGVPISIYRRRARAPPIPTSVVASGGPS